MTAKAAEIQQLLRHFKVLFDTLSPKMQGSLESLGKLIFATYSRLPMDLEGAKRAFRSGWVDLRMTAQKPMIDNIHNQIAQMQWNEQNLSTLDKRKTIVNRLHHIEMYTRGIVLLLE